MAPIGRVLVHQRCHDGVVVLAGDGVDGVGLLGQDVVQ